MPVVFVAPAPPVCRRSVGLEVVSFELFGFIEIELAAFTWKYKLTIEQHYDEGRFVYGVHKPILPVAVN